MASSTTADAATIAKMGHPTTQQNVQEPSEQSQEACTQQPEVKTAQEFQVGYLTLKHQQCSSKYPTFDIGHQSFKSELREDSQACPFPEYEYHKRHACSSAEHTFEGLYDHYKSIKALLQFTDDQADRGLEQEEVSSSEEITGALQIWGETLFALRRKAKDWVDELNDLVGDFGNWLDGPKVLPKLG